MSPSRFLAAAATLALLFFASSALPCPLCPPAGQTLTEEVKQSHLAIFGATSNAKHDPNEFGKGTTDIDIDVVVKDHEFLKGKKKITLPRFIPPDPKNKIKHLIFCEIYKGELDPYRGIEVPADSKLAEYLMGALAVKDKEMPVRLQYFFKHLDTPDWSISGDAFQEISKADYKDVRTATEKMDPDHVLKVLKDPGTSAVRFGLLGMVLGHCGKADKHAKPLKEFIDDPEVKKATGLDGLLVGLVLLDPKTGAEYVNGLLKDKKEDFLVRYAALRALRFFWEFRDDVLSKAIVAQAIKPLLDQPDIVDLAIEDLRKWQQWELGAQLIALFDKPTHDAPIIQRSIIKFALSAPAENKACAAFLTRMRADEMQSERVKDLEQLLELEKPRPAAKDAKIP
jgi:hypothetical protein